MRLAEDCRPVSLNAGGRGAQAGTVLQHENLIFLCEKSAESGHQAKA